MWTGAALRDNGMMEVDSGPVASLRKEDKNRGCRARVRDILISDKTAAVGAGGAGGDNGMAWIASSALALAAAPHLVTDVCNPEREVNVSQPSAETAADRPPTRWGSRSQISDSIY